MYIEAAHGTAYSTTDNGKLFLFGLQSAVREHRGCIVDKISDARLSLFITTMKLVNDGAGSSSSVVSVALAVPLNGVPVYIDNYMLVIRDTDSVGGQVNGLLENIGATLQRYGAERH
jgi:hypothetical protein